ncbi:hypothetical protein RF11_07350 [Thelohanellus kitauei]|uniref:Uncharacterized protein n=1 Tax=Thelohanellus kitauei TaxID=669202 RepID=A0A0C2M0R0_THEKT|nr:hypothetical protein RF11_07350 [Thelohanellus kitauei]
MTILLFHISKSSLTKCSLAFQNMICIVHGCSCIQVNQAECIPNVSQFGIILQCFLIEARKFSQKHDSTGLFEYEFLLMDVGYNYLIVNITTPNPTLEAPQQVWFADLYKNGLRPPYS